MVLLLNSWDSIEQVVRGEEVNQRNTLDLHLPVGRTQIKRTPLDLKRTRNKAPIYQDRPIVLLPP